MRKRLILYPVVFVVALGLSYFLAATEWNTARISFYWVREAMRMDELAFRIKNAEHFFDTERLVRIPDGESPLSDLPEEVGEALWRWEGFTDSWGHPYRVVREPRKGIILGVYSTGHDGLSTSNGNDPDDINSWGQNGLDFYPAAIAYDRKLRDLKQAKWVFPFVLGALVLVCECLIRRGNRRWSPTRRGREVIR